MMKKDARQETLKRWLANIARRIIRRYRPTVVGITGTVGKTTTKGFIAHLCRGSFSVRSSSKNYNNEIGLPLTIIGADTGGRSVFRWLRIFLSAWWLGYGWKQQYPDVLILEMGVDHPGDLDYLLGIVRPTHAALTAISPVHMEFFESIEELSQEKQKLIRAVPKEGTVVINADSPKPISTDGVRGTIVRCGAASSTDITIVSTAYRIDQKQDRTYAYQGLETTLRIDGKEHTLMTPALHAKHQLSLLAVAIGVGKAVGIRINDLLGRAASIAVPPGRMNILQGVKHTTVIDDSYNASPEAAMRALDTLATLPSNGKKWAVLGDMAELGKETERDHRAVGAYCDRRADRLVAVGQFAAFLSMGARAASFPEDHIKTFETSEAAGRFLQEVVQPGDLLLIKGSQAARMERVTKELMAEPLRAPQLLVRQGSAWK